jgi:hypothetical protein
MHRYLASVALIAGTCGTALAGPGLVITPLLLEGDSVSGVGQVTLINNLAVNSAGQWIVEADTNQADTDTDEVLIKSGVLYLREGDPLTAPAGAAIDSFDSINLNNSGNSGWNFFLSGTGGTNNDSGIFYNATLVLQEGTLAGAPQFSPNTPYIGFFEVKINDGNQLLSVLSVDDPAIASTVDRALVRFDLDANGLLLAETVIAKEADILSGQTEMVTDFGTGPHTFAFSNSGAAMYVADLTGDTTHDGVVYINDTLIAQEADPSPVAGRDWLTLGTSTRMDLNNNGDYVHTGTLSGDTASDLIIVRNGVKLIQEGDTLPAIGGVFTFTSFGSGPVLINDSGGVLWFGDWNDPDTTRDTGLFLDETLLAQEGVTTINGMTLTGIASTQDAFAMSDDGQYILFEGTLDGTINGAFLIHIPPAVELIAANPPLPSANPYQPGQPFTDVLDTGTSVTPTQGIGAAGTPPQGPIQYSPILVTFSAAPAPVPTPANISVTCTGGSCPMVTGVTALSPMEFAITLDHGIPPLQCTTLTFAGGQTLPCRSHPANVSLDSVTNTQDLLALVQALNNGTANEAANLARYNVDRSGGVNTQDLLRIVRLLNGVNTSQVFNGASAAACP